MNRVRIVLLFLFLGFPPCPIAHAQVNWGDSRPIVGSELNGVHTLKFANLGIEAWDGQRPSDRIEGWDMECRFASAAAVMPAPGCSLTRQGLRARSGGGRSDRPDGTPARRLVNRTADGTLRFDRVDWKSGIVQFQVGRDQAAVQVTMTVHIADGTISLDGLRGVPVLPPADQTRATQWRIAEYDRRLDGTTALKGLHSEDDRRWDQMIRALSAGDRKTWATIRQSPDRDVAFGRPDVDVFLNELLEQELAAEPDKAFVARLRDDLPEEPGDDARLKAVNARAARTLHDSWGRSFGEWLDKHGMSAPGRQRILAFLQAAWKTPSSRTTGEPPPR